MELESFYVFWHLIFLVFLASVFIVVVGENVGAWLVLTLLILGCDLYIPMTIETAVWISKDHMRCLL